MADEPYNPSESPILKPGEVEFRLSSLNKGWVKLRANVLGPGIKPPADVPKALADQVAAEYREWKLWYDDVTPWESAGWHWGSKFSLELDEWTKKYIDLRAKAVAVLGDRVAPGATPLDKNDFDRWLRGMATKGLIGGFALAMFWVWLRRPRLQRETSSSEESGWTQRPREWAQRPREWAREQTEWARRQAEKGFRYHD